MQAVSTHYESTLNTPLISNNSSQQTSLEESSVKAVTTASSKSNAVQDYITVDDDDEGNNTDDSQELLGQKAVVKKDGDKQDMPSSSGSVDGAKAAPPSSTPNNSEEGNGTAFPKYSEYMNNKPFSPNASGLIPGSGSTEKFAFDSDSRTQLNHIPPSTTLSNGSTSASASAWKEVSNGTASNFLVNGPSGSNGALTPQTPTMSVSSPNNSNNNASTDSLKITTGPVVKRASSSNQLNVGGEENAVPKPATRSKTPQTTKTAKVKGTATKTRAKADKADKNAAASNAAAGVPNATNTLTEGDLQLIRECFGAASTMNTPSVDITPSSSTPRWNESMSPVKSGLQDMNHLKTSVDVAIANVAKVPAHNEISVLTGGDMPEGLNGGGSGLLSSPRTSGFNTYNNGMGTFPQLPFEMTKFFPTSIGGNVNEFEKVISGWGWYTLDGVQMPCVFRDSQRLAAVHIVQMKLLSKFPPNIPNEVAERHVMVSHRMLPTEAWIFNIVNACVCHYELGCQIFTPNDELVDVDSVEHFYWVVKEIHLTNLVKFYESELRNVAKSNLMLHASILRLKKLIEDEIGKTRKQVKRLNLSRKGSAQSIVSAAPSSSASVTVTTASCKGPNKP